MIFSSKMDIIDEVLSNIKINEDKIIELDKRITKLEKSILILQNK